MRAVSLVYQVLKALAKTWSTCERTGRHSRQTGHAIEHSASGRYQEVLLLPTLRMGANLSSVHPSTCMSTITIIILNHYH